MKAKVIALLSALLASLFVFNLVGCTKKVNAENLLDGVTPQAVEGMQADEQFALAQMEFALKLFKGSVATTGKENALISPLSVMIALAMTANGADGETLAQMESVLGMNIDDLNEYLYTYVNSLPNEEKSKLELANSIWINDNKRVDVKQDFLQRVANYYDAEIFKELFNNDTLKNINNWVDDKTDGLIKDALDKINEDTILYLINTLLFEAEWSTIYEKHEVIERDFTSVNNEKQSAEMMCSTEWRYIEPENASGFIKSYKNNAYSFVAILPNEGMDINAYIAGLSASDLLTQINKPKSYQTVTRLPKFEYDYSIEMQDVLKNMGMPLAFDEYNANFTKMATPSNPAENVYIGRVIHKTSIKVAEKGTKAGAVTIIDMKDGSAAPPEIIKYVYLDRPFVYMIIDNQTNLPIFIGNVNAL